MAGHFYGVIDLVVRPCNFPGPRNNEHIKGVLLPSAFLFFLSILFCAHTGAQKSARGPISVMGPGICR